MILKIHFHVILFLLSSLYITTTSSDDFDKWISWNVKSYHQKKTVLGTKWNLAAPDLKLRQAESDKVRITVSQDGAGDFKTITEAINSIPPRNTRRVIVMIAPGVYRYVVHVELKFVNVGDHNS